MLSLKDRFNDKYIPVTESGCWLWTGAITNIGYGQISYKGKMLYSHRVSYELVNGSIPNGMIVMHKCDNRTCVNPDHLVIGSQSDNIKDMYRKGRAHKKPHPWSLKTHCKNGHEFTESNTYNRPNGGRDCRTCLAERARYRRIKCLSTK